MTESSFGHGTALRRLAERNRDLRRSSLRETSTGPAFAIR
jgi:hypothetical protein